MPRVLGVVSGKGGVGKTVTAANLSLAMQELGEQVVAVDADITASNLALQLDMHPTPDMTLQDALEGKIDILRTISMHPSGLMLIPSSLALKQNNLDAKRLKSMLNKLHGTVILDAPPGLGEDVYTVLEVADETLIVTEPEIPAVADAVKIVQAVKQFAPDTNILGIIVNKAEGKRYEVSDVEIEVATEVPIIAKIPFDRDTRRSIFERVPLIRYSPYSKAAIEYRKLAAKLMGKEYKPPRFAAFKRLLRPF